MQYHPTEEEVAAPFRGAKEHHPKRRREGENRQLQEREQHHPHGGGVGWRCRAAHFFWEGRNESKVNECNRMKSNQ